MERLCLLARAENDGKTIAEMRAPLIGLGVKEGGAKMLTIIEHVRNCENKPDCVVCNVEIEKAENVELAASEEKAARRGLENFDRIMFEDGAKERRYMPDVTVFGEGHPFYDGWNWQDERLLCKAKRERRLVIEEVACLLGLKADDLESRLDKDCGAL